MKSFEIGKTYFAEHRINRVFFKVVARIAKTVTFAYAGTQKDVAFRQHAIDVEGNGELQKSRVRIGIHDNAEQGYVTIEDSFPWRQKVEFREVISAEKEARLPKSMKTA